MRDYKFKPPTRPMATPVHEIRWYHHVYLAVGVCILIFSKWAVEGMGL